MSTELVDRFIHKYSRLPTEKDPRYLEMLQMSKYRILDVPDVNPANCANCGSTRNDGRKYIDFGLNIEWHGVVYLCGLCLTEIARAAGCFRGLEVKILMLEKRVEELLNVDGVASPDQLEQTVLNTWQEVKNYFDGIHAARRAAVASSVVGLGIGTQSNEPKPAAAKSKSDGTKQGTTQQTSGARLENIPSLAKLIGD